MANINFKPWLGTTVSTGQQAYYSSLINAQPAGFQPKTLIKAQDFNAALRMATLVCAGIADAFGFDTLTIDAAEDTIANAIKNYKFPNLTAKNITADTITVPQNAKLVAAGQVEFNHTGLIDFNTLGGNGAQAATVIKDPGLYLITMAGPFDGTRGGSVMVLLNVTQNDFFKAQITSSCAALYMGSEQGNRPCYITAETNNTHTFDTKYYYISKTGSETAFIPKFVNINKLAFELPSGLHVGYVDGTYVWKSELEIAGKNLPDDSGDLTSLTFTSAGVNFRGIRWDEDNQDLIYSTSEDERLIVYSKGEDGSGQGWINAQYQTIVISTGTEIWTDWQDFFFANTIRI